MGRLQHPGTLEPDECLGGDVRTEQNQTGEIATLRALDQIGDKSAYQRRGIPGIAVAQCVRRFVQYRVDRGIGSSWRRALLRRCGGRRPGHAKTFPRARASRPAHIDSVAALELAAASAIMGEECLPRADSGGNSAYNNPGPGPN